MKKQEQTIDLRDLFKILKKHLFVIMAVTIICGIAGFALSNLVVEKKYVSEALLYVENSANESEDYSVSINDINAAQKSVYGRLIFTSDNVLDKLAEDLFYLGYTAGQYKKMITVSFSDNTELLKVSVESGSPETSKLIADKVVELSINEYDKVIKNSSVKVVSEATIPKTHSFPDVTAFTLISLLIGFFITYFIFLLMELFDTKLKPGDDPARRYNIPVFAEIVDLLSDGKKRRKKTEPLSPDISRKLILNDDTQFVIKEAYKAARTNLTFALANSDPKIAVVTSCAPAEGKSTNCLNLAITMAEMGESVLLIDGDMRKPVQHSLLRLENDAGLSSILGGLVGDVSKVINKNVRPNLDIITAGPIPPNPLELLAGERMQKLIDIVGKHYDYIFIDTPPVTVVADAFVLNERTSGIVFVIKESYTTHPEIEEALRRTKMTNGKILGFIKSNCAAGGKSGGKSYKYKYKYKYNSYS